MQSPRLEEYKNIYKKNLIKDVRNLFRLKKTSDVAIIDDVARYKKSF